MARSRRGRLQRGRRVPHPQRCSRPAARPSGPPALTGKASAPPRTDGSPPPRESGHGKGKEEPRLVCQGLGYPSPSSLRPRSPGPQTLLPQTQESRNPPLGLIGTQASAPQPSLRFQGWIAGFLPNFSSPAFQASISFLSCLPLISLTCAHDLISPLSPSLGLPLRGG